MPTTSVLFVCLGNICRSPMAEALFRHRVAERGLDARFSIDSAGTADYHIGEPAHPMTLQLLSRRGVAAPSLARQVRREDFDRFDWILAMDRANLRDLRARAPAGHRARRSS